MAGINLSQVETAAKRKPGFFDGGTIAAFVLFILVLGIFGGMRWYSSTLDQKNQSLDAALMERKNDLSGERVDRLADFDSRLKYVEQLDLRDATVPLAEFEKAIIPSVVVSKFVYDNESGRVTFTAETPAFKSLAQQIQTFKSLGTFEAVRVNEIQRLPEGGVLFSLEAQLLAVSKQ